MYKTFEKLFICPTVTTSIPGILFHHQIGRKPHMFVCYIQQKRTRQQYYVNYLTAHCEIVNCMLLFAALMLFGFQHFPTLYWCNYSNPQRNLHEHNAANNFTHLCKIVKEFKFHLLKYDYVTLTESNIFTSLCEFAHYND